MAKLELAVVAVVTIEFWYWLVKSIRDFKAAGTLPPIYVALCWDSLPWVQKLVWTKKLRSPEETDARLYEAVLTHTLRQNKQVAYFLQDLRPTEQQLLTAQRQVHRNPYVGYFGGGIIAFDITIAWAIGVLRQWEANSA